MLLLRILSIVLKHKMEATKPEILKFYVIDQKGTKVLFKLHNILREALNWFAIGTSLLY